jgi:hypothetical protein
MTDVISLNEKLTKQGIFKDRKYTAVWFTAEDGLPDRWECITDYDDEEWDEAVYQYLNPLLFEDTA